MSNAIPLKLSKDSPTQRIMVGLSWDMRHLKKVRLTSPEMVKKYGYGGVLLGKIEDKIHAARSAIFYKDHINPQDDHNVRNTDFEQYDLDLECYIFDAEGQEIEKISPDFTEIHNEDLSVFHSSEDYTGVGVHDDEDISIKIADLPEEYHHFLFVVKSDCAFDLDEISNASVRLYDAYSGEETLKCDINPDIANKSLYVFAHLYKDGDGFWMANPVNHYGDYEDDMSQFFKNNLK